MDKELFLPLAFLGVVLLIIVIILVKVLATKIKNTYIRKNTNFLMNKYMVKTKLLKIDCSSKFS